MRRFDAQKNGTGSCGKREGLGGCKQDTADSTGQDRRLPGAGPPAPTTAWVRGPGNPESAGNPVGHAAEGSGSRRRIKEREAKPIDSAPMAFAARLWKTKREMADYLGCTQRHINTLMRRRVLPYIKHRGFVRFDLEECDRALEAFKTRSLFGTPERRPPPPLPRPLAPPLPPGNGQPPLPRSGESNHHRGLAAETEVMTFKSFGEACAAWEHPDGRPAGKPHRRQVLAVIVVWALHAAHPKSFSK